MALEDGDSNWFKEAAIALDTDTVDPSVKFDVLNETAKGCTNRLELIRVSGAEDIERFMASVPTRDPEGPIPVVIDGRGGNVASLVQVAVGLDQMLFPDDRLLKGLHRSYLAKGITVPDYVVKGEYEEIGEFKPRVVHLAHLLNKQYGDECIDLVLGLLNLYLREEGKNGLLTAENVSRLNLDKKRKVVDHLMSQLAPFPENKDQDILSWALGTKFMHRLSKDHKTVEEQLRALKQIFDTNAEFRDKLLRALRGLQLTPDRLTTSALMRWGWETIDETEEVTDYEWWAFVQKQHEGMKRQLDEGDEEMVKHFSEPSRRDRFDLRSRRIKAFFDSNPTPPAAEDVKKLKDVIGCDRLREELTKVNSEHNPRASEEKEREILARVSGAVSRYVLENVRHTEEGEPSWQLGTPVRFRETKNATCFTGPWLIALMLMECGIQYEDLIYAHVNQAHDGQIGGHGGLVVKTRMRHNVFMDHGYSFAARDLPPTAFASSEEDMERLAAFLDGKIDEPVTIQFKRHEVDRIHRHMQFMPLNEGFTSGHLYHVGLRFLERGDLDRAEYAFELALTFNREDPDIIYHRGVVALRQESVEEAERYFERALKIFPDHLFSEFSLGICLARRGHYDTARHHFQVVAESPYNVWRASSLKERATHFSGLSDMDLQSSVTNM